MEESILDSTKKILGLEPDDTTFDVDVLTHLNTAFSTLTQLGVGPSEGFMVMDATPTWDTFLQGDARFNQVRTYVYLRVRMLFDPPTSGYAIDAMKQQLIEMEWRLTVLTDNALPYVPVNTLDEGYL